MIRVLFMGRKPVAARCLKRLLCDARFKVVGVITDSHLETSPTADIARDADLPLFDFESAAEEIDGGALQYELGISMLYWRRLKHGFLTHPPLGSINFHPAPLPEYKGVGGYNLAILEGLQKWGVSAHFVDQEIDNGPIIKVKRFPIDPALETARSLEQKTQRELEAIFWEVMDLVATAPDRVSSYANGPGAYLTRTELEKMKVIDIERDDIDRKVRAFWFPPYDGAFIEVAGVKYTLVNRQILETLADPQSSSLFTQPAKRS